MSINYSSVCSKILKCYKNLLTDNDIARIELLMKLDNYNENSIAYINGIINLIWQKTLTNVEDYQKGHPFVFLVTRDYLPFDCLVSGFPDFNKIRTYRLCLLTEEKIKNLTLGYNGMIISVDFNKLENPILPIDFLDNNDISVKTKINPVGVFNVGAELSEYDGEEMCSKTCADIMKVKFIDIIKPLYTKELNHSDYDFIVQHLIYYYLIECKKLSNVYEPFKTLKYTYNNAIIDIFKLYLKNEISLDECMNMIFSMLDDSKEFVKFDK